MACHFRVVVACILVGSVVLAADAPQLPAPQPEHLWLGHLVGDWEMQTECSMGPGQPPMKCQARESVKAIGKFWVVSELHSQVMEMPMHAVMTLGYDRAGQKFIGTWIDSSNSYLWHYTGSLDTATQTLTLESEGPHPLQPGKVSKFRDVTELKSPDHRVMTSQMLGDDGQWVTFMTGEARRSKDLFKPL